MSAGTWQVKLVPELVDVPPPSVPPGVDPPWASPASGVVIARSVQVKPAGPPVMATCAWVGRF